MTVTTTPTGAVAYPLKILRDTLAACTEFRTWTGAGDTPAALAKIYYLDVPIPASNADSHTSTQWDAYRPFAVVDFEPRAGVVMQHFANSGSRWDYRPGGVLWLHLEQTFDSDNEANPDEEFVTFMNTLGKIIRRLDSDDPTVTGLLDLAGAAGYLAIRQLTVYGPYRADEDERPAVGDFIAADFEITWGNR